MAVPRAVSLPAKLFPLMFPHKQLCLCSMQRATCVYQVRENETEVSMFFLFTLTTLPNICIALLKLTLAKLSEVCYTPQSCLQPLKIPIHLKDVGAVFFHFLFSLLHVLQNFIFIFPI